MTITTKDLEAGGLKQPDQSGWGKGGKAMATKKPKAKKPKSSKK